MQIRDMQIKDSVIKDPERSSLKGVKIGFGITGSFCTFRQILDGMRQFQKQGCEITAIYSWSTQTMDTRFYKAEDFHAEIRTILGEQREISSIQEAETIGPRGWLDLMVIAPCTGNHLAKLASGITDSPVLMAAKAHLRNKKPVLIYLSTNDALGINGKHLGALLAMKNIYFVPFGQDDWVRKENSMVSRLEYLLPAAMAALEHRQLQPLVLEPLPKISASIPKISNTTE